MRIGEVARRSGVSARMLRHYDSLGLVRPTGRTSVGYREYSPADIGLILQVEGLRSLGLSLKEIDLALRDPDYSPERIVAQLTDRTRARIAQEQELLDRLEHVAAAGPDDWNHVLDVVHLLTDLEHPSAATRQQAALSAADLPAESLADALLREPDLNVAGAIAWALSRSDGAGLASLVAGLDADEEMVRRRAVETLARLDLDGEHLHRALSHRDDEVRGVAAIEFGTRGDAVAVDELVAMIVRGDRDVAAAEALGVIVAQGSGDGAVERVADAAAAGREYAVRQRAVQALAELPGPAAEAALRALSDDADPRIAHTAAAVLRYRGRSSQ